jgi:hypothetical protein
MHESARAFARIEDKSRDRAKGFVHERLFGELRTQLVDFLQHRNDIFHAFRDLVAHLEAGADEQIGRASCRERVLLAV